MKRGWLAAVVAAAAACSLDVPPGEPAGPARPGRVDAPPGDAPIVLADAGREAAAAPALAPIAPPFDVASTAAAIDAWPRLFAGVRTHAVTSFDRSGGNDDGFGGTYSELYTDAVTGEHVLLDEVGPGVLRTLWFTSAGSGDTPLALGRVRFYFDDETTARIDVDADALFAGGAPPFAAALVDDNQETSGGFASWAPLAFRGRLRVTTEKAAGFYAAHVDTFPADWDVASWTTGQDDALVARFASAPAVTPAPIDRDATLAGEGIIELLRFVPTADLTDDALAAARIRIWFDGATAPQVDVPLGLFFGSGRGYARIDSVAWTMQPRLLESRLPLPFWSGARIAIDGIDGQASVHRVPPRWPRAETGTLEVHARPLSTTGPGDVVYADVTGSGKLVATVLAIDPEAPATKRWWEGDLRVMVDGARTPAIHGTGHEDDHLGGWSNELLSRPFTRPMQGCPRTDLLDTGAEFQKNGATTMYRLWPGIGFTSALRQTTEHGPGNSVTTRYAAAAFVYRRAQARRERTDAFDVGDRPQMQAHAYRAPSASARTLTSAFEGENDVAGPATLTATVHDVTGPLEFTLAIDPANEGVFLRRLADRSEAPARATLEVDGVAVTTVATWGPIAAARAWHERDVFVPAQLTRGKSRLSVRWIPAAGSKSSAARFEAWSIVQKDL
ncbi:MAG: DUF2961 domain-containing protein [Labilithrix sp.]|nr:DUF2961 domain-containing protein [Labilithrix sp.]MCW5814678.1 DUF2961 domain-containing protein [Labilithrix sp.]